MQRRRGRLKIRVQARIVTCVYLGNHGHVGPRLRLKARDGVLDGCLELDLLRHHCGGQRGHADYFAVLDHGQRVGRWRLVSWLHGNVRVVQIILDFKVAHGLGSLAQHALVGFLERHHLFASWNVFERFDSGIDWVALLHHAKLGLQKGAAFAVAHDTTAHLLGKLGTVLDICFNDVGRLSARGCGDRVDRVVDRLGVVHHDAAHVHGDVEALKGFQRHGDVLHLRLDAWRRDCRAHVDRPGNVGFGGELLELFKVLWRHLLPGRKGHVQGCLDALGETCLHHGMLYLTRAQKITEWTDDSRHSFKLG